VTGLFILVNSEEKRETYISHTIKKGESVSLICLEYYGYYSSQLGLAVKRLNSSINDINFIVAGSTITLASPVKPQEPKPLEKVDSTATLFEKKAAITQGVITCVEGNATIISKGSGAKTKLIVNSLVFPGDIIETGGNGRVEIIINRESVIRMRENSRLKFDAYRNAEADKGKTSVNVFIGSLWTKVRKFKDKLSRFELTLPNAIAGVHGTVYETSVLADSSSEVKVYTGEVSVQNVSAAGASAPDKEPQEVAGPLEVPGPHEVALEEWTRIVKAMQKITVGKDGKPSDITHFKQSPGNSWEQWNQERDKRIAELFSEKQ
jgi:hypothetical protein